MEIKTNQITDSAFWVPVCEPGSKMPARAFLPVRGFDGIYTWGYKPSTEQDHYLKALIGIQRSFCASEKKIFVVKGKSLMFGRATWRDTSTHSGSLLGPSLGWVLVEKSKLESISAQALADAISSSGEQVCILSGNEQSLPPLLCDSAEALETALAELRMLPLRGRPAGQKSPKKVISTSLSFSRDAQVVHWVLQRSKGHCESCSGPAPFQRKSGDPYLEVHHVKTLAEGGSDTIENAVALCPNCHREIHFGHDVEEKVSALFDRIPELSPE